MIDWVHSIPTWTMSPRGANPKFQGNVVLAGIADVAERMIAITKLNSKVKTTSDKPLLTSVHILHEMRSSQYRKKSSPNAITFTELRKGIKDGDFPRILAVTAPAFGFAGVEGGAILSSDPKKRSMARNLHLEAIRRTNQLKEEGLGEGVAIWWPAFDSRRLDLPYTPPMPFERAWKRMVDFWVSVLQTVGGTVWLEWKPSDPGIDYICTLKLAIDFCNEVNKQLDRKGMVINNEWAHLLIGGLGVAEGTERTIKAGLFTGFVHVNSAQLLQVSVEHMMKTGTPFEEIATGVDWDWAVGMGGQERWRDQQKAVSIMETSGAETIFAEHDINPAGQDPIAFAKTSIQNLEGMISDARDRIG